MGEGSPRAAIGTEWNPAAIGWRRGYWAAIGEKGELRELQPIAARRGRALIQWRSGAAPGPRLALSPLPSSSGPAANQRAADGGRGWRRRRTALPLAARGARSGLNRRRRAGGERTEGGVGGVVLTRPRGSGPPGLGPHPAVCRSGMSRCVPSRRRERRLSRVSAGSGSGWVRVNGYPLLYSSDGEAQTAPPTAERQNQSRPAVTAPGASLRSRRCRPPRLGSPSSGRSCSPALALPAAFARCDTRGSAFGCGRVAAVVLVPQRRRAGTSSASLCCPPGCGAEP